MNKNRIIKIMRNISLGIYSFGSSLSLGAINIGLGLTLVITLMERIIKFDFKDFNKKLFFLFSIFFISTIVSYVDSINLLNSIDYIDILLYPFLIIAIITFNNFSNKEVKYFTIFIVGSIFVNMIYGLYQYRLGIKRVNGNVFVMEFATLVGFLSIFLFVYLINNKFNIKYKIPLVILFFTTILAIIFSGTRGVWVAFPLALIFILIIINKKYIIYFLIFIILGTAFIFIFLPDYYFERMISIFDLTNNRSNTTRLYLWQGALSIFLDHPINGIGLNNFSSIIKEEQYYNKDMVSTAHAHNNILQLAAETGILGVASFLYLVYKISFMLYEYIKKTSNKLFQSYYIFVLGSFILYNLQGLTEYNLEDKYTTFIIWILISFSFKIYNNQVIKE